MRRVEPEALAEKTARMREELSKRSARARAQLGERRAALAARPAPGRSTGARSRRRWLLLLLLLALLLALCLGVVECDPPAPPPVGTPLPPPETAAPGSPGGGASSPRLATPPRPAFPRVEPPPVPWLEAFRSQVAARGPRLAACFVGADHPGTLRWSADVEPIGGRVSDPELEPLMDSVELTGAQEECVIGVLAEPRYTLDGGDGRGTPTRVVIVLEF